jgi:hypothetical protein
MGGLGLELGRHQRDCQMDENVADLDPRKRRQLWIAGSKGIHTWLQK